MDIIRFVSGLLRYIVEATKYAIGFVIITIGFMIIVGQTAILFKVHTDCAVLIVCLFIMGVMVVLWESVKNRVS